jgi:hypothetical protein
MESKRAVSCGSRSNSSKGLFAKDSWHYIDEDMTAWVRWCRELQLLVRRSYGFYVRDVVFPDGEALGWGEDGLMVETGERQFVW